MENGHDRYFKHLCDSLGFSCFGVDLDLNVQYCNRQAAKHFGRDLEALRGHPVLEILEASQQAAFENVLRQCLANKVGSDIEVKYEQDGGRTLTFVMVVSPILDESGACLGASVAMRDISQRKRLSQELARTRRMASLGKMAEGVAHHFNNILGGMMTSIDFALPSDSPRELRKTLRLLSASIGRATRITNQLAAFAERENELQDEAAPLNELMGRFVSGLVRPCEAVGVELITKVASIDSGPFEARRLLPVLESLSQNALDAMSGGGTLTVAMQREGDEAVISIADSGCGIPEDAMEHLFEPFFTTKGGLGSGTAENIGLGLAAVHGLVSELGGTIQFTSKVGQGTTVYLRLPIKRESGPASS